MLTRKRPSGNAPLANYYKYRGGNLAGRGFPGLWSQKNATSDRRGKPPEGRFRVNCQVPNNDALSQRVFGRGQHGRGWYQCIFSHGLIYFLTPGGPVGGGGANRSCTRYLSKALPHPVMGSRWAEWGRNLRNFRCTYGADRHQLDGTHLHKAPDCGPGRRGCRGRRCCFGSKRR